MPDILIRGMEMPKTCCDCLVCCEHSMLYMAIKDRRSPYCPLHELPPHGDLIDRDMLLRKFCNHCDGYEFETNACVDGDQDCMDRKIIMSMPVIVPASEEVADENP